MRTSVSNYLRNTQGAAVITSGFFASACAWNIQDGPDMDAIAAVYESPDGALREEELEDLMASAQERLEELAPLESMSFVLETLVEVAGSLRELNGSPGAAAALDGIVEVTSRCRQDQGMLVVNLFFERGVLRETVSGDLQGCRIDTLGHDAQIDADLQLHLGAEHPISRIQSDKLLYRLDGEATIGEQDLQLAYDFRILGDSLLEFRLPAHDGEVVFAFGEDLTRAAVRTRDGSFCCHFGERECYGIAGATCESAQNGDKRLTW